MKKYKKLISLGLIALLMGFGTLGTTFKDFLGLGISNPFTTSLLAMILLLSVIGLAIKKPKTFISFLGDGFSILIHWIFIVGIYYGIIHNTILKATGINPRTILLVQTLLIIIVVGIIDSWTRKRSGGGKTWTGYALISIFGPVLIMLFMFLKPYNTFNKDTGKGNLLICVQNGVITDHTWTKPVEDKNSTTPEDTVYSEKTGLAMIRVKSTDCEMLTVYFKDNPKAQNILHLLKPKEKVRVEKKSAPKDAVIFTGTYHLSDARKDSEHIIIPTFVAGKDNIQENDIVRVKLFFKNDRPYTHKNVMVSEMGDWVEIQNGTYQTRLSSAKPGQVYLIWLKESLDIKIKVDVIRFASAKV